MRCSVIDTCIHYVTGKSKTLPQAGEMARLVLAAQA